MRASPTIPVLFDESAYLSAFDDVIVALTDGSFATAREHFDVHGRREGRLLDEKYLRAAGLAGPDAAAPFALHAERVFASAGGIILIVGWLDDRASPLKNLLISFGGLGWVTTAFGRIKRDDVETELSATAGHQFGFWSVINTGMALNEALAEQDTMFVRGHLANGCFGQASPSFSIMSDTSLRATILGYFASANYSGNRDIESFLALDSGIGECLVALNRPITQAILAGAWVSNHGPRFKKFVGSIIVCLFGKPHFLSLQTALFSTAPGMEAYEFVYVSNSPELTETLDKQARNAARIYGVSITLVCLPDNAGFGAANNIAAQYAQSDRLLITNPDVFPRDDLWPARHASIIENAPAEQTALFGAPLYYGDGSLMHHGMYFESDAGISIRPDGIHARPMLRTEHFGKGTPAGTAHFVCPRPVPAVTGAFMSADRAWFESLGGFNEDYLFGHYEDADLCLKSLAAGKPVWMQDFPLWHMEGAGGTRAAAHEGGSLVNRWLFTRNWADFLATGLMGPQAAVHAPAQSVVDPRQKTKSAAVTDR